MTPRSGLLHALGHLLKPATHRRGRRSWVDIDPLYSVHARGMRREASAPDLNRFVRVAGALRSQPGREVGN